MKSEVDFLVVGRGIAGSVLSDFLLKKGFSVHVLDIPRPDSATRTAAGMFNPITGHRTNKTQFCDLLFPFLHRYYTDAEKRSGRRFFYPSPLYRPYDSVEAQNMWTSECSDPVLRDYARSRPAPGAFPELAKDPFGGLEIRQAGYLDTNAFLEAMAAFPGAPSVEESVFEEEKLELFSDGNLLYDRRIRCKKAIFCRGTAENDSKFFSFLRFKSVRGEILHIKHEGPEFSTILSRGCWLIPGRDGICKVGSTYDHGILENRTTEKGKQILLEKLDAFFLPKYEIVNHTAGIRPASYDRLPFIGLHPERPEIGIFNGFGAKGISLTPYFAGLFADFLAEGKPLPPEVSPSRCLKYGREPEPLFN